MLKHVAIALIWLACISAVFACVAAMKSNGATEHPLLVDAAAVVIENGKDAPIAIPDPDLLFTPCPLSPQNIPSAQKRDA